MQLSVWCRELSCVNLRAVQTNQLSGLLRDYTQLTKKQYQIKAAVSTPQAHSGLGLPGFVY